MTKSKIAFAGCKDTTIECITALLESGYKIDLLITIDPATAQRNKVAGYVDLTAFAAENKIDIYICDSYSLTSEKDKNSLSKKVTDLLLVIGWQRLIPEWLLKQLTIGAFGMHGSPRALPYGRGRSPMNWSLIQGKDKFITNLFKYNPGVDDGDILATEIFDLNSYDTARTCHYKNTLSMIKILRNNLDQMLSNDFVLRPQLNIPPSFYPKRTAEDGMIFWDRDTSEIYNLVRAVTRPFPGAITLLNGEKIIIWSAQPFDTRLFSESIPPGTILNVFVNGDFIVKTGSDSLLVTEYEPAPSLQVRKGDVLDSGSNVYKSFHSYPAFVEE
jgi:methionyl-tRNA formyltransferase